MHLRQALYGTAADYLATVGAQTDAPTGGTINMQAWAYNSLRAVTSAEAAAAAAATVTAGARAAAAAAAAAAAHVKKNVEVYNFRTTHGLPRRPSSC